MTIELVSDDEVGTQIHNGSSWPGAPLCNPSYFM